MFVAALSIALAALCRSSADARRSWAILSLLEDRAAAMAPRRDGIDMAMAMMVVLRVGCWCYGVGVESTVDGRRKDF